MSINKDEPRDFTQDYQDKKEADRFAEEMDDILLDLADLDPENCPPDRRISKGDREAWVYEHGNIAELVFVKV